MKKSHGAHVLSTPIPATMHILAFDAIFGTKANKMKSLLSIFGSVILSNWMLFGQEKSPKAAQSHIAMTTEQLAVELELEVSVL